MWYWGQPQATTSLCTPPSIRKGSIVKKIVDRDDAGIKAAVIPVPLPVARTRVVSGRAEAPSISGSVSSEQIAQFNQKRAPLATSVVSLGKKPQRLTRATSN